MAQELNDTTQTHVGYIDDHPEVVVAIGLFIARWSLAEAVLNIVLSTVIKTDIDIVLGLLAATPSAEGKIRLVRVATIQSNIPDPQKLEIAKALRGLSQLCDARNEICHHTWGATNHDAVITWDYRQPPGKMLRHKFRTSSNINALSNRAVMAAREISKACGSGWLSEASVKKFLLPVEAD